MDEHTYLLMMASFLEQFEKAASAEPFNEAALKKVCEAVEETHFLFMRRRRRRPWAAVMFVIFLLLVLLYIVWEILFNLHIMDRS